MTTVLHVSDLHFGRSESSERLESLKETIAGIKPDAVAVSGDLTQRCTNKEFTKARKYLDEIRETAPCVVIPGNHDIRWLGAVIRNLGVVGLVGNKAHDFKYSRYTRHISDNLSPSLEVPGAVIASLNTAHGITRGSLTTRIRDLGVIGHVKREDVLSVEKAFENADPDAARVVMIHHNPIKGSISGRHGLANTDQALRAFARLGTELVLCGHDHQEAVHTAEKTAPGLIISTSGTISNRLRPGRASSFNVIDIEEDSLCIITYAWNSKEFAPSSERSFPRRTAYRSA